MGTLLKLLTQPLESRTTPLEDTYREGLAQLYAQLILQANRDEVTKISMKIESELALLAKSEVEDESADTADLEKRLRYAARLVNEAPSIKGMLDRGQLTLPEPTKPLSVISFFKLIEELFPMHVELLKQSKAIALDPPLTERLAERFSSERRPKDVSSLAASRDAGVDPLDPQLISFSQHMDFLSSAQEQCLKLCEKGADVLTIARELSALIQEPFLQLRPTERLRLGAMEAVLGRDDLLLCQARSEYLHFAFIRVLNRSSESTQDYMKKKKCFFSNLNAMLNTVVTYEDVPQMTYGATQKAVGDLPLARSIFLALNFFSGEGGNPCLWEKINLKTADCRSLVDHHRKLFGHFSAPKLA